MHVGATHVSYNAIIELAEVEARTIFHKDVACCKWATMHGGVYVPVTDKTQPNRYLAHISERDIIAPSGKKLTLVDPAYMTRQVFELDNGVAGIKGHVTSLNPILPRNSPDQWEKRALQKIQNDETIEFSIEQIDYEQYLRKMFPFYVEESCLKCHAKQGDAIGYLRGVNRH